MPILDSDDTVINTMGRDRVQRIVGMRRAHLQGPAVRPAADQKLQTVVFFVIPQFPNELPNALIDTLLEYSPIGVIVIQHPHPHLIMPRLLPNLMWTSKEIKCCVYSAARILEEIYAKPSIYPQVEQTQTDLLKKRSGNL